MRKIICKNINSRKSKNEERKHRERPEINHKEKYESTKLFDLITNRIVNTREDRNERKISNELAFTTKSRTKNWSFWHNISASSSIKSEGVPIIEEFY